MYKIRLIDGGWLTTDMMCHVFDYRCDEEEDATEYQDTVTAKRDITALAKRLRQEADLLEQAEIKTVHTKPTGIDSGIALDMYLKSINAKPEIH